MTICKGPKWNFSVFHSCHTNIIIHVNSYFGLQTMWFVSKYSPDDVVSSNCLALTSVAAVTSNESRHPYRAIQHLSILKGVQVNCPLYSNLNSLFLFRAPNYQDRLRSIYERGRRWRVNRTQRRRNSTWSFQNLWEHFCG